MTFRLKMEQKEKKLFKHSKAKFPNRIRVIPELGALWCLGLV